MNQRSESEKALLVRYRNDGDDFHILWSARRALRLLNPTSGLVGVAIEGASEAEAHQGAPTDAGLLVIDTAEYYGPSLKKFDRVVYYQLKYSTTASRTPWPVSGLADTLKGFSNRFKNLPKKKSAPKAQFVFVTNRPISPAVIKALTGSAGDKATLAKLQKITGLRGGAFKAFCACLDLQGQVEPRQQQESQLHAEATQLVGQVDSISVMKMKALIHQRTTSDAAKRNTITRDHVLDALGTLEEELLPSPARFENGVNLIPRVQERTISKQILAAAQPIVIHAEGGVGKSVLAQRLPILMPSGSEVVVFDGFAAGGYRAPRDRRHLHSRGLVHIANTLASRNLCNVLIPTRGVSDDTLLRAFRNRLAQAALAVRQRSKKAVVLIVLDAADNSVMAAKQYSEKAFPVDMLQEAPPDGCRMVALARSHRLDLLELEHSVIRISLNSFSRGESAAHLAQKFPGATGPDIDRFHKYTDSNPRVQANALAGAADLQTLLAALGPSIRKVEALINSQLDAALGTLKAEQHGDKKSIDALCRCLAVLPPLIPLSTLARAAGVRVDEIKNFASDFSGGRPLLVLDKSIQFRDEPVETWFRDKFAAKPRDYAIMADALAPTATTDAYAAASLPQLLLGADRYKELVTLALTGPKFKGGTALEQREISLRRVRFALKAAIGKNRMSDVAKLMLRAGEEVVVDDRLANFMLENADWISAFNGTDSVFEYIFRRRAWHHSTIGYAHCAIMLAHEAESRQDAERFLKMAMGWLYEWGRTPGDKRTVQLEPHDIAEHFYALHLLKGPELVVDRISTWTPKSLSFVVGNTIAGRVLERGNSASALALLAASKKNLHLRLGILMELAHAHVAPPTVELATTLKLLEKAKDDELKEEGPRSSYTAAIVSTLELAARTGAPKTSLLRLIARFKPAHKRALGNWDRGRNPFLRFVALEAALRQQQLDIANLVPEDLQALIGTPAAEHNDELRNFRRMYGALSPWYEIRALAVTGQLKKQALEKRLRAVATASTLDSSWHSEDRERTGVANEIPRLWGDVLSWGGIVTKNRLVEIWDWVDGQPRIFTPTWTRLAEICAHHGATAQAIKFAARSKDLTLGEPGDAKDTAEALVKLAKALYICSKHEALSYFRLAMERLGKLGDDTYDRLYSLAKLAEKAGDAPKPRPQEAYRFARAAEALHAHSNNDFPWRDAASAVAGLCTSSAFAIAARWHDRQKVSLDDSLAPMVRTLLERRRLDPKIAGALHVFSGYWNLREKPELFFRGLDKATSQRVLDYIILDHEFDRSREDLSTLLAHTTTLGLDNRRIRERASFNSKSPDSLSERTSPIGLKAPGIRWKKPNWTKIFSKCDLKTAAGIETACDRYKGSNPPLDWKVFFSKMRGRVRASSRSDHVGGLAMSSLSSHLVLEALEAAKSHWAESQSVQDAVHAAVSEVIRSRSTDLARNRWAREEITRCRDLGGLSDAEVLTMLTSALSNHIDGITAASWFYLAGEVTRSCLKPNDAYGVLSYGLDQLEPLIDDDMGDGAWRAELVPPKDIEHSVACFIFALLCTPAAQDRWRAAHAVRRLCALNLQKLLRKLTRLCAAESLPAFSDHRLPFYIWNGRLYLMISLGRGAVETPFALKSHIPFLVDWALDQEPHALIRHFASKAVLYLSTQNSNVCPPATLTKLRALNVSSFPRVSPKKGARIGWTTDFWRANGFGFPYDFDRYWIGPLAEAFNLPGKTVAKQIADRIIKKWGRKHNGHWDDDPRAKAGHFRDLDTGTDHGGHPAVDRLSFYLGYHSMFCTASELLSKRPTSSVQRWAGDGDMWANWLNGHTLTRQDGRWLSDARGFAPLERRRWQKEQQTKDWRYSILVKDFDEVLGINGATAPKTLPIWGSWNCSHHSQKEDITITSALVSPSSGLSLLRALQVYDSFSDFRLPDERDEYESTIPGFELAGWIHTTDGGDRGLDRFDSFASNVRWPAPTPGRLVRRFWKLKPSDDARTWNCGQELAFSSAVWGSEEERNERSGNYGHRLTVQMPFLRKVLKTLQKDLIIEVSFRRDDGSKKEIPEYRHGIYARLYILKENGELYTFSGSRRLWRAAR